VARFSILGLLVLVVLFVLVVIAAVVYLASRWASSSREDNSNLRPIREKA
jgi:predicted transporter